MAIGGRVCTAVRDEEVGYQMDQPISRQIIGLNRDVDNLKVFTSIIKRTLLHTLRNLQKILTILA